MDADDPILDAVDGPMPALVKHPCGTPGYLGDGPLTPSAEEQLGDIRAALYDAGQMRPNETVAEAAVRYIRPLVGRAVTQHRASGWLRWCWCALRGHPLDVFRTDSSGVFPNAVTFYEWDECRCRARQTPPAIISMTVRNVEVPNDPA